MTPHQIPPSVPTDKMVERAAHRFMEVYFRNAPDDTLIDVEEVERAMLSALTAALAAMPGGVDEEELGTIIVKALRGYRLSNMVLDDDPGEHLPLVDLLSNGPTIADGIEEIEQIADAIAGALLSRLNTSAIGAEGQAIIDAALAFIEHGTKVTKVGGEIAHVVIERADKSDPHYALCKAVEAYRKATPPTAQEPTRCPKCGEATHICRKVGTQYDGCPRRATAQEATP